MDSRTNPAGAEILSMLRGLQQLCAQDPGCDIGKLAELSEERFSAAPMSYSGQTACGEVLAMLRGARALAESDELHSERLLIDALIAKVDIYFDVLDGIKDVTEDHDSESDEHPADELPQPIDFDTDLANGQHIAGKAMLDASWEIDTVSARLLDISKSQFETGDFGDAVTTRLLANRLQQLNSYIMSYLDDDAVSLKEAFCGIYGDKVGIELLTERLAAVEQPVPSPLPSTTGRSQEADFMAGVALAVELCKHGEALYQSENCTTEFLAMARLEGDQQENFALEYIRRVITQPELAEGFSAVLSCELGDPTETVIDAMYGRATYAEITGPGTCERFVEAEAAPPPVPEAVKPAKASTRVAVTA